jgi:hypothetical protein
MSESEIYTDVAPEDRDQPQEKPRFNSKTYHREYYQQRKDVWKDKYGKKVDCEQCGASVSTYNYKVHIKSKKHLIHEQNKTLQKKVDVIQQMLNGTGVLRQ